DAKNESALGARARRPRPRPRAHNRAARQRRLNDAQPTRFLGRAPRLRGEAEASAVGTLLPTRLCLPKAAHAACGITTIARCRRQRSLIYIKVHAAGAGRMLFRKQTKEPVS